MITIMYRMTEIIIEDEGILDQEITGIITIEHHKIN
jgi:hypothetical protein